MEISKAIEILGDSCWDYIPEEETDIRNAVKLGIEALKHYQDSSRFACGCLLLGQTGETERRE